MSTDPGYISKPAKRRFPLGAILGWAVGVLLLFLLVWWLWPKSKPEGLVYTQAVAQMISKHNEEIEAMKKEMGALKKSQGVTGEVIGKHETWLEKHDKQIAALDKKCSSSCPVAKPAKQSRSTHAFVPAAPQVSTNRAEAPVPNSSVSAKFWGWFNYESSPSNPKPCLADRPIRGKLARCSTVIVMPANAGETEDQWTTRAAASQGVTGENKHLGKVSQ